MADRDWLAAGWRMAVMRSFPGLTWSTIRRMAPGNRPRARPEDATLLDVLIDGFEKNEVLRGFHWRVLPVDTESAAIEKYESFFAEARAWKGAPLEDHRETRRRLARWEDLQIRQLGRAIMVLARAPSFSDWWHERETWRDDPFGLLYDWLDE